MNGSTAEVGRLPRGPAIWIGGDCHLGNLGPLADEAGDIDIQIRDLDQSVIKVHYDLIRLGLSLATAVRGSNIPGVTTAKMLDNMLDCYAQAFGRASKGSESQHKKPDSIGIVMRRSLNRSWKQLASDRIEDTKPTNTLGKRFWPLRKDEKLEIKKLFEQGDARDSSLRWRRARTKPESKCWIRRTGGKDAVRWVGYASPY